MNRYVVFGSAFLIVIAVFGWNPFYPGPDMRSAVSGGYTGLETGVRRLPNGVYEVNALTRMPGVKAHMVEWWLADFMQTTEHYTWWHPTAHIWMDWENKVPGEIVGASHLVHEYIGPDLQKLRIQFVEPEEILGDVPIAEEIVVVCARPGPLDGSLYVGKMCHIIRNTPWGAEMRSRFWLGHVSARVGNEARFSLIGLVANTALARYLLIDRQGAVDLMTHAVEEMGYLGDLLPDLFAKEAGEVPGGSNAPPASVPSSEASSQ